MYSEIYDSGAKVSNGLEMGLLGYWVIGLSGYQVIRLLGELNDEMSDYIHV